MRYTRAQMQLNETILVMFVVVLMLIIGMIGYYRYSAQSLKNAGDDLVEEEVSVLLASVTEMPEISCSNDECLDMAKIAAFSKVSREEIQHYKGVFGSKRILVEALYPEASDQSECNMQKYNQVNYPENCRYWVVFDNKKSSFDSKIIVSSPISIYYPEMNRFAIGKIILEVYR